MTTRRALFLSFAQRYVGMIIYLASTVILARLLTPREIGVFSLCAALTGIASSLRDFGISEYLIQERELTHDRLRAAYGMAFAIAWSLGILVFLSGWPLAAYYGEPGLREILAVTSLNFFLLPFGSPAHALLTREMAFGPVFIIQTAAGVTQAATSVALAWNGFSYMSLAWASIATTLVQILVTTYYRPRETWVLPGFREWARVWAYGSKATGAMVLGSISMNAHEFIIGRQFGFSALGLYNRAAGLMAQFHQNMTEAILRVAKPAFAASHRAGSDLKLEYGRAISLFTGLAWPFFAFVGLMAGEIIHILFGVQWADAAPLARIFAMGSMIYCTWAFAPVFLASTGHIGRKLRVQVFAAPLTIAITLGASFISLQAVAVGGICASFVTLLLYGVPVNELMRFSGRDLIASCSKSAGVTVVTLAISIWARTFTPWASGNAFLDLMWVGVWAAAGWYGTVFALRHPLCEEMERAWGHMRQYAKHNSTDTGRD